MLGGVLTRYAPSIPPSRKHLLTAHLEKGEHLIEIDANLIGPTCGLLPVGIDSTILTTRGLRWDLGEHLAPFQRS